VKIPVANIIGDAFQEYENEHSIVLFLAGCNLNCKECYNREEIKNNPKFYIDDYNFDMLNDMITPAHTAMVMLGGEPTAAALEMDLINFTNQIKTRFGLKIKWFTNGQYPKFIYILNQLNLIDSASVDLKCIRDFKNILGVDIDVKYINRLIETISYLNDVELRTTKWECVQDQLKYIEIFGKSLINSYPQIKKHIFQDKFSIGEQ